MKRNKDTSVTSLGNAIRDLEKAVSQPVQYGGIFAGFDGWKLESWDSGFSGPSVETLNPKPLRPQP